MRGGERGRERERAILAPEQPGRGQGIPHRSAGPLQVVVLGAMEVETGGVSRPGGVKFFGARKPPQTPRTMAVNPARILGRADVRGPTPSPLIRREWEWSATMQKEWMY